MMSTLSTNQFRMFTPLHCLGLENVYVYTFMDLQRTTHGAHGELLAGGHLGQEDPGGGEEIDEAG